MSRKCKCCNHRYLKEINIRLLTMNQTGDTFASIAHDYENIDAQNVQYHYYNHIPGTNNEINEKDNYSMKSNSENDSSEKPSNNEINELNSEVDLREKEIQAWDIYEKSLKSGDLQLAVKAEAIAIDILKLRDRRKDEGRNTATVNLEDTEEWVSLRGKIIKVLHQYPEALEALREVFTCPT